MGLQIFERVRRLLQHASALAGNRLDLLELELQEEIERALGHLAWLLALFVLLALFLLSFSAALLIAASQHGLLLEAAFALTAFYALLSLLAGLVLRKRILMAPPAFSASRAEFLRDEALLRGANPEVSEGEA